MAFKNLNKKNRLIKMNKTQKNNILIMLILLISFLMVDVIGDFEFNPNLGNIENDFVKNLKTNDLSSDNTFTGIGAPWNVTHYANTTLQNLDVSFYNNSFDASNEINLDSGWMGYQLNSTITDLYATRNLINGTFNCGNFTGDGPVGDDDSAYVDDWTFYELETGMSAMSGNYYDIDSSLSDGADCLELRIFGYGANNYDSGDKCAWNGTFSMPEGEITDARLSLALNPKFAGQSSGFFTFRVRINNKVVMARNLYAVYEHNGGAYWGEEKEDIIDFDYYFPEGSKYINISLEFAETGDDITGAGEPNSYGFLFDNVSLVVKTKSNPSDIELKLNGEEVNDGATQGEGFLGIRSNWDGDVLSSVIANFSSDYLWPYTFEDEGNLITYKVEFTTDLALYATKTTPESYYLVDPNLNYQGSAFSVSNSSDVSWTTYAHMEIPSGYEETNLTVEYPSDYSLNGIFFSQDPNSLSQTTIKDSGNTKIVNIPVSSITSNTNGFWKLTAESPNYCEEMNLYNDATGDWEISKEFRSGDYLNVTAKISNSALVSGYIEDTYAKLQIRFPNGTIWHRKTQLKSVENTGMVYFDPILIPETEPNYEVGEYEAIVTWNNSHSIFGFNETGLIFKTFTVIHDSYLEADDDFFENIFEGDIIILRVSFTDANDDSAIRNANVFTTNFMDELEQFSETSPGYYILEFNTSGGHSGNNYLDITAEHPLYEDNQIQITVELIFETELTAEEYPSLKAAWNTNFTVHLNYTYLANGTGIENADTIIEWNGDWSKTASNGLYNITFNSSRCEVNKIYNLKLSFDKTGCESQVMIISVEVVLRETSISSILINDRDCTANKSYNVRSGELLDFKVTYNDLEASGVFIKDAVVTLNKSTEIGEIFEENPTYYNFTLNSISLGIGTSFINIIAQKANYTSKTVLLTINVFERDTEYEIFLNGIDYTASPQKSMYTNQLLTINVTYIDSISTDFISGAIVDINGSGVSEVLVESYGNYSVTINTESLNFGANFLTIYARKDGYEPQSISVVIQIVQIESELILYLDGEDKTSNPAIMRYPNQLFTINVTYKEDISELFISGATIDINGSGVSEVLGESSGNYSITIDTDDLNFGANFLTIYARKNGYEPQSIVITVQIQQIETELVLYLDDKDKTSKPTMTSYVNEIINIDVTYKESVSQVFVSEATVDINGSGISEVLGESSGNYSITIDTDNLNFGANFLTIYARKNGYEAQSIILTIQIVQIETELELYLDDEDKTTNPAITKYPNQLLTIDVTYKEDISELFISGATVDINGSGVSEVLVESSGNYSITIDTDDLNLGANFLTVYARKNGFEPQSIVITIQILQIETELVLYLDGDDKTSNAAITKYPNQLLTINVTYKEFVSQFFISGATVDINGSGVSEVLGESSGNYSIMIDTDDLNFGANFLTIYARKNSFEPQSIIITVQIIPINTELLLYLDEVDKTSNPAITKYANQLLNIDVRYMDLISTDFIGGATVDINGTGVSEVLVESSGNYSITIDTNDLNFGANFLTIYARKDGFEPQSIIITVQIALIDTELLLYLDGEDKTSNPTITLYPNQFLSINVSYIELISTDFINGATVDINGSGISEVIEEVSGSYSIILDTSNLNLGANFLTIYARRNGFEPHSMLLTIQVVQIETKLELFLNSDNTSTIHLTYRESLNVTIKYKDLLSAMYILNASVELSGTSLNESLQLDEDQDLYNYWVLIDTEDLGVGIHFFTILAQKSKYEAQTVMITLEVIVRETDMEIFVNEMDITSTRSFEIAIGKSLNITIKYTDFESAVFLPYATVTLLGTDIDLDFNMDLSRQQYYIIIDTESLDIGVEFLTILAKKDNYQSLSPTINIEVQRIKGLIYTLSNETVINTQPGRTVTLSIVVRDPVFGVPILDANVTYTSAVGQGQLLDSDNDGIYIVRIVNLPEGTHTLTITVYAGDNYDFERYRIVISVVRPPEETLLFQLLTIIGIGAAIGVSGYLFAYQKVLKYPKPVRKIRRARSKVKKDKPLDLEISSRDELIQQHYSQEIEALEKQVKKKISPKLSEAKSEPKEQKQLDNLDSNTSEQ